MNTVLPDITLVSTRSSGSMPNWEIARLDKQQSEIQQGLTQKGTELAALSKTPEILNLSGNYQVYTYQWQREVEWSTYVSLARVTQITPISNVTQGNVLFCVNNQRLQSNWASSMEIILGRGNACQVHTMLDKLTPSSSPCQCGADE